jgi:hypothetical protein
MNPGAQASTISSVNADAVVARWMEGERMPKWLSSYKLETHPDLNVRLLHIYETSGVDNLGDFLRFGTDKRFSFRNYGRMSEAFLRNVVSDLLLKFGHQGIDSDIPGESIADKGPIGPSFDSLLASEKPWRLISSDVWDAWAKTLEPAVNRRISDIADLFRLPWPNNARDVVLSRFLGLALDRLDSIPHFGKKRKRTVVLAIAYAAMFPNEEGRQFGNAEEILQVPILRNLDKRERFILEKRLLTPEPLQVTLDVAGREQGVTRERIRQIETIILRQLRESSYRPKIAKLLENSKVDIFQRLAGGEHCLTEARLESVEDTFGGPLLLAVYVEGKTLRAWLDANFLKQACGWFSGTREEWQLLERRLRQWRAEQFPLPESVVAGSSNVTVREARAYFELTGVLIPFEGYFLPSATASNKRAVRLHSFASSQNMFGHDPALIAEAFARATIEGDAAQHVRSGYKAILTTPTLFLASPGASVPIYQGAPWREQFISLIDDADGSQSKTNESFLVEMMRKCGPISLNNFADQCLATKERLGLAASSVGAMVSQSVRFGRLAPGLYDLRELGSDSARITKGRELLLSERDVRRYCFAKQSGEDLVSMFPLWDFGQEMRWALWGKTELPPDVWGSLMAVSSPERWRLESESDRPEWLRRKAESRWRLKVSWHDDLPDDVPRLRDVLLVARCAKALGSMTWIRANYALGASQVNERIGMSAVILAVILGLIEPLGKSRWGIQRPNSAFEREWTTYENALLADPELTWQNSTIAERFAKASLHAASGELGWVETNEISVLRSVAMRQQATPLPMPEVAVETDIGDEAEIKI